MIGRERAAYLFLSLLQSRTGASVISRLGELSPETILEMSSREVARKVKMTEHAARAFDELKRGFDPQAVLESLSARGIDALTLADEDFPERLREAPDPPPALYVDGAMTDGVSVAIVGSRKSSVSGDETARRLGRALGERGVCVVSGLALGVDAAAHRGALEARGPTIGVLGCGIDVVYPKKNRELFDEVKRCGALVSEYYLGEPPLAWRFPARNRIISGLCDVIVVVEAAEKSGALITARHALESGRDVWAVPGPIGAAECKGSNKLLSEGAGVIWSIQEFVDSIAPNNAGVPGTSGPEPGDDDVPAELPEKEAATLLGVGFEPTEVDVISARSGVSMSELLSALTMLELKGYVYRSSSGAFTRTSVS